MTSTISDSQHRETTDLIDTTSQIIHSTTNDYESSTSDNQHTETTDVTVITASTIYTTNDDISSTSDNQHPETTDLPVTTASTIYTTNDDITSTSDNWHSETTDLTVTTGTTIYTTTNDLRSTSSENWFSRTTYSTDPIDHTINTTSDLSSSISTQSNASVTSCMCTCDQLGKEALVYLTSEDIKKKVNVLVEELRIDKRDTSLGMCNTLYVFCILNVHHYHWIDTTVGEQLVPESIASPVIITLIYITITGYTPMQLDW